MATHKISLKDKYKSLSALLMLIIFFVGILIVGAITMDVKLKSLFSNTFSIFTPKVGLFFLFLALFLYFLIDGISGLFFGKIHTVGMWPFLEGRGKLAKVGGVIWLIGAVVCLFILISIVSGQI